MRLSLQDPNTNLKLQITGSGSGRSPENKGNYSATTRLWYRSDSLWPDECHRPSMASPGCQTRLCLAGHKIGPAKECGDWCRLGGSSDYALLQALDSLARKSKHPEIAAVPWVLCGHSGGAWWTGDMLLKYPERILGAVPGRINLSSNIIETVTIFQFFMP
jgi:pimeloyl-ACP methyl ester carboxylesterase